MGFGLGGCVCFYFIFCDVSSYIRILLKLNWRKTVGLSLGFRLEASKP